MLPKKNPKPMQGPGSSCPPLAVPPNLAPRAPRGRAAPAPLTCRRHVCCCCLPCSSSSSPSSSSLPLPAAWGSLWRFIHSCLPIGPSAFPCLPEAERVTPRPFPATFCCHRAALPQPGAAAGLGHAWAAPGRGSVPSAGRGAWAGVGTAPTRPGGVQPVPGTRGFPLCPPLSPSPRQAAAHRRWFPPSGGSAERARLGPHPRPLPGQPSPFLSHSALPSILFQLVFPPPLPLPGPHPAPPSAAPSPPLTEALTQARSGAAEPGMGGQSSRPPGQSRVLPIPPPGAVPSCRSSSNFIPAPAFPRTGVPPTAQRCTSGGWGHAPGPYRQHPTAPRCRGEPGESGGV